MSETLRLGDHCSKIGSGATPRGGKDSYLPDGPVALIRSQNVHNNRFVYDRLAYISLDQAAQLSNVEVQPGDVLLNITGDSVARVCQVDAEILPARVNQHVAIIRPRSDEIDPQFLRYFLVSRDMQALMLSFAGSGGTRNALTKSMIESFEIPAKSIEEQRAIASTLAALDDKIELNRRMNETLEAMARAIFRDWFVDFGPTRARQEAASGGAATGKENGAGREPYLAPDLWVLFPDRLDDDGKPEGWEVGALSDVASLNPESWSARNQPDAVRYVDLSNTKWGVIEGIEVYPWKDAPSRARRVLRSGDTIVGTVRPGNGSFAFISDDGLTGSTGFAVLRPKDKGDRALVWCAATSPENIERLSHLADGAAYPAVRPDIVADTEVTLADEGTRRAFSSHVAPLLDKCQLNLSESRTLAATRDLLLPRLMSGEVCVAEATELAYEAVAGDVPQLEAGASP